jgi:hypothetical protein
LRPAEALASGLRIEALPDERSDIGQPLDTRLWKFRVTLPDPQKMLVCSLEIRRRGKPLQVAGGAGMGPFLGNQTEVMVGLHPVGYSWRKSGQFKSLVQIEHQGGGSLNDNPFKGCPSYASGGAERQRDGTFLLVVGSRDKPVAWSVGRDDTNDVALMVRMEMRPLPSSR